MTTTLELHLPVDIPATIPEGSRNVTMTRIAGAYRAQGLGGGALVGALERENLARCRPPLPDFEIRNIARSMEGYTLDPVGQSPDAGRDAWRARQADRAGGYHSDPQGAPKADWRRALEPPGEAWQARARAFVAYAEAQLWETPEAVAYLRGRGLADDTIRAAGLGYNPRDLRDDPAHWGLQGGKVWLPAGWVIPNESGSVLWGVNMRRAGEDPQPKYVGPRDGRRKLYGLDRVGHHSDLVICEGEFDALLLWQECGAVLSAVALGGSENLPDADTAPILAGYRRWWIATDNDDAGRKASAALKALSARARDIVIPEYGNDVTDLWRAGVDLVTWAVGIVGPSDPGDYQTWAQHYMDTLDDAAYAAGADSSNRALCVWKALLNRHDERGRE